jgi:neprilysin
VIPDDKTSVSSFSVIDNQMMDHLRIIVNEEIKPTEITPFQNLKKINRACLNLNAIEELGTTTIKNKMNAMGGWPVLESSWNDQQWSWEDTIAKLREHGFSVSWIFQFSVITDPQKSTARTARVSNQHSYRIPLINNTLHGAITD